MYVMRDWFRIRKELSQLNETANTPVNKWARPGGVVQWEVGRWHKRSVRSFHQRCVQIHKWHIRRCLLSAEIREMQTKAILGTKTHRTTKQQNKTKTRQL